MENNATRIQEYLSAYSKQTGGNLSLDEQGHCALATESGMQLAIEAPGEAEQVFFYAAVLPLLGHRNPDLLGVALELNMALLPMGGATFALDAESDTLLLCLVRETSQLDENLFCNTLANFVLVAGQFQDELTTRLSFSEPAKQENPATQDEAAGIRV